MGEFEPSNFQDTIVSNSWEKSGESFIGINKSQHKINKKIFFRVIMASFELNRRWAVTANLRIRSQNLFLPQWNCGKNVVEG